MTSAKYDNTDGRLRGRALQARRLRVWSLDPHCQKCGKLVDYPDGFALDHINPVFKVGEDLDDKAVQCLCHPCHDKKSLADMGYRERVEFDKEGRVKW
jgi:5-methylcytosine-specific restriction enzyme A